MKRQMTLDGMTELYGAGVKQTKDSEFWFKDQKSGLSLVLPAECDVFLDHEIIDPNQAYVDVWNSISRFLTMKLSATQVRYRFGCHYEAEGVNWFYLTDLDWPDSDTTHILVDVDWDLREGRTGFNRRDLWFQAHPTYVHDYCTDPYETYGTQYFILKIKDEKMLEALRAEHLAWRRSLVELAEKKLHDFEVCKAYRKKQMLSLLEKFVGKMGIKELRKGEDAVDVVYELSPGHKRVERYYYDAVGHQRCCADFDKPVETVEEAENEA